MPFSKKAVKIDPNEEIKKFQSKVESSVVSSEKNVKEERRKKSTFLTSMVFNSFLMAAGFLTILLVPALSAIIFPPVGVIIIGGFGAVTAGGLLFSYGMMNVCNAIHDRKSPGELQDMELHLNELKESQELLENDSGFHEFLVGLKKPLHVDGLKKYAQLYLNDKKIKSDQEKLESLEKIQKEEEQTLTSYRSFIHKEDLIESITKRNEGLRAKIAHQEMQVESLFEELAMFDQQKEEIEQLAIKTSDKDEQECYEHRLFQLTKQWAECKKTIEKRNRKIGNLLAKIKANQEKIEAIENQSLASLREESERKLKDIENKIDQLKEKNKITKAEIETNQKHFQSSKPQKANIKDFKEESLPSQLREWLNQSMPQKMNREPVKLDSPDAIYTFGDLDKLSSMSQSLITKLKDFGYSEEYRFLSNEASPYSGGITINGITYKTVEHYFQAQKAIGLGDDDGFYLISNATTAKEAREIAHNRYSYYQHPLEDNIMKRALFAKFVNPDGKTPTVEGIRLIQTGKKALIAGHTQGQENYYHGSWGALFTSNGQEVQGENKLGLLLTELREMLIKLR